MNYQDSNSRAIRLRNKNATTKTTLRVVIAVTVAIIALLAITHVQHPSCFSQGVPIDCNQLNGSN